MTLITKLPPDQTASRGPRLPIRFSVLSLLLFLAILPSAYPAKEEEDATLFLGREGVLKCFGAAKGLIKVSDGLATFFFTFTEGEKSASYQIQLPPEESVLAAPGLRMSVGGGPVGKLSVMVTDLEGGVYYYKLATLTSEMTPVGVDFYKPDRVTGSEKTQPGPPYKSVRIVFAHAPGTYSGSFQIRDLQLVPL